MRTLDFETSSSIADSESGTSLATVQEDKTTPPLSCSSPHKKSSSQLPPLSSSPTKKKTMFRSRAHSSSVISPSLSGSLKNSSGSSIGNGKVPTHSSGPSSSHHSSSNSGSTGSTRSRTLSVGGKPVSSSSTPRRPNSGHSHHRDKRHSNRT